MAKLFVLLEKFVLVSQSDDFAAKIYSLLVFLLIEWHENKVIRSTMISNFIDLFKQEKVVVLSLHQLIEPLCSIITLNIQREEGNKNKSYLNMIDFSLFWELANDKRITAASAIQICEVMQIYMLLDSQFRGIAQKIFYKLISTSYSDDA